MNRNKREKIRDPLLRMLDAIPNVIASQMPGFVPNNEYKEYSKSIAVSYNPCTHDGYEETALVIIDGRFVEGRKYAILDGDFRKNYERIIKRGGGRKGCIKFYEKRLKRHGSFWSDWEGGE